MTADRDLLTPLARQAGHRDAHLLWTVYGKHIPSTSELVPERARDGVSGCYPTSHPGTRARIAAADRAERFHERRQRKQRAAELMTLLKLCGMIPPRSTRKRAKRKRPAAGAAR